MNAVVNAIHNIPITSKWRIWKCRLPTLKSVELPLSMKLILLTYFLTYADMQDKFEFRRVCKSNI